VVFPGKDPAWVRGDVITPTYHHERREARRDRGWVPVVSPNGDLTGTSPLVNHHR